MILPDEKKKLKFQGIFSSSDENGGGHDSDMANDDELETANLRKEKGEWNIIYRMHSIAYSYIVQLS